MTARKKIQKATRQLKKAGFDVRNPDYDRQGKGDIRWIFSKPGSTQQVGCIHVSTDNSNRVHAYFEF